MKSATVDQRALEAVAAYIATSDGALDAAQRLNEAWKSFFYSDAEEPSSKLIAEVAERQKATELALERARLAMAFAAESPAEELPPEYTKPDDINLKRRRRHQKTFLKRIGRPGQRLLRGVALVLLGASALLALCAGISLALEVANFLHLIDDTVQLPVVLQLAIFLLSVGGVFCLTRAVASVERALYGIKGERPKRFPLRRW